MGAAASPLRSMGPRRGLAGLGGGLALLLPLLLAGCSGTSFGDNLARSFSAPAPPAPSRPPAAGPATGAGAQIQGETTGATPVGKPADGALPPTPGAPRAPGVGPAPSPPSQAPAAKARPAAQPSISPAAGPRAAQPASLRPAAPAPYRVTLRLPQADPSAPAEVVTRALRAAGVPFEVETIERMGQAPGALTPRPAPAPRP